MTVKDLQAQHFHTRTVAHVASKEMILYKLLQRGHQRPGPAVAGTVFNVPMRHVAELLDKGNKECDVTELGPLGPWVSQAQEAPLLNESGLNTHNISVAGIWQSPVRNVQSELIPEIRDFEVRRLGLQLGDEIIELRRQQRIQVDSAAKHILEPASAKDVQNLCPHHGQVAGERLVVGSFFVFRVPEQFRLAIDIFINAHSCTIDAVDAKYLMLHLMDEKWTEKGGAGRKADVS